MLKINPKFKKYFKNHCYTPEVIMTSLYIKGRYSLSYREIEEIRKMRGLDIDHATLQRWVVKFITVLEVQFKNRKKPVSGNWMMDETYIKVKGQWVYLYRAVDELGNTIDFLLRSRRDKQAAKASFNKAIRNNIVPSKVNIDKSDSNNAALLDINKTLPQSRKIIVRQNKYMNNRIEGDHRFIKKRTRITLASAARTIGGIEIINMINKNQLNDNNKYKTNYDKFLSLVA